jgi:cupin fold WbuC family metalloprotein
LLKEKTMEKDRTSANENRQPVEFITCRELDALCRDAAEAPRGRTNRNYHQSSDTYQRLLNVIQPGSYIAPHRHQEPAKSESFIVLRGAIGFFQFDDAGEVTTARRIGPDCETRGVDLAPGVWHCFVALATDTVVFEGKNGPYDPRTDKQFAAWAPREGDPKVTLYLDRLLTILGD